MAVEIATAYFSLLPSMAGTAAAVRTGLTGAGVTGAFSQAGATQGAAMGAGVAGGLGKAVPVIAGALAALGVADFIGNAVNKASDLNESANAVRVTFGEAADEVARLGETAAGRIGLSETDFAGLAVRYSAFASTIAGDSRGVADVLDELTTRAADFASVMNLDVADAAQLFQSGLAGESEPLRRYGIDVSAATVAQTAYRLGITETGKELTETEKIQARYAAIMEQTAKVQGDFANTSDQFANSQRINQANLDNAIARIGTSLLPAAEKFATFAADKLIPLVEKAGPLFEKLEPAIGFVIDALLVLADINFLTPLQGILDFFAIIEDGKITVQEANDYIRSIPEPLQDLVSGFTDFMLGLLRGIIDFANGVLDAVEGPVNAVRELIGLSRIDLTIRNPGLVNPLNLPQNFRPSSFSYTLPGAARGGVMREGGMVRVGEYGPENLYLPQNAVVEPLPERISDGARFEFNGVDPETVYALFMQRFGSRLGGRL